MRTIPISFATSDPAAPRIVVVGKQIRFDLSTVSNLSRYMFGERWNGNLALVLPARNEDDQGFQTITSAMWGEATKADGVWHTRSRPGSVLAMVTADCATVVGWQPKTDRLCLAHAGRPALKPHGTCECQTILSRMANVFGYRPGQAMHDVQFAVTPHIASEHFRHDFHDEARSLIDPFRPLHQHWPEYGILSDDGTDCLDLASLIQCQLQEWYQVPAEHVAVSAIDTFTSPELASRRGKDTTHNLTLVLL